MKKNKKLLALLMAGLLILQPLTIATSYAAEKQINIKVDGFLQRSDYRPLNISGNTMVEAEALFRMLGLKRYVISLDTGKVTFYFYNKVVDMSVNDKTGYVNGTAMKLAAAPEKIEDRIYLPLRYVAERCSSTVGWIPETNTVTVNTTAKDYSIVDYIEKIEPSENTVKFTLTEAVVKVMKDNNDIKKADKAISDAKKKTEDLEPDITFMETNPNSTSPVDLLRAKCSLQECYDIIDKSEINKKLLAKQTEYTLINTSNTIENSNYNILLMEKNIALAEINIKNMELKASLGQETTINVQTAKNNLAQSKINLTSAKTDLQNLKISLNNLLDVPYDKEVVITYDLDPAKFSTDNLDKFIEQKIEKDLNIELKWIDRRYQGVVRETHYELPPGLQNDSTNSYGYTTTSEDVEANYTFADEAYKNVKKDMDYKMRKAYNSLVLMDEKFISAQIEYNKSMDTYKTVSVNYETGNAIMQDVLTAELDLLNKEISLQIDRSNYALEKYRLENPMFLN